MIRSHSCNSPTLLLATNIVCFGFLRIVVSLTVLKRVGNHTPINNVLFPSLTVVRSHNNTVPIHPETTSIKIDASKFVSNQTLTFVVEFENAIATLL